MACEGLPADVFVDTCVLLNFVQREWERDYATTLVTTDSVTLIVSETILEELADVSARRQDIYTDMVEYLLETEEGVEEYNPSDRRVYIGSNDATHVRNLQEHLAGLDDQRVILRRLRRFVNAAKRRAEYVESMLKEHAIDPMPPLELRFAIDNILDHNADTKVVTDAATWTANGGSGVLVTLDNDDIFENEERINELLAREQGSEWVLQITRPEHVLSKTSATGLTD